MSADVLVSALRGAFDRWQWSAGLTPSVVGAALGVDLQVGTGAFGDRPVLLGTARVEEQAYPVRFRWTAEEELLTAELSEPTADPSWEAVLAALGEPDVVLAHGRGPHPGSEQRCHLSRGLTVFDGAGLGYQAVWLYPPTTIEEYPGLTGAFTPVQRMRRRP